VLLGLLAVWERLSAVVVVAIPAPLFPVLLFPATVVIHALQLRDQVALLCTTFAALFTTVFVAPRQRQPPLLEPEHDIAVSPAQRLQVRVQALHLL